MRLKYYFLCFLVFTSGCNSKTTSIDVFCQKLDHTLSVSEKTKIRECPDVGCLVVLVGSKMRKKFADAYDTQAVDINQFLIDSFRIDSLYDRQRALLLAYQEKLIGKAVDFFEIKNEMVQYDNLQDSIYDDKERKNIENHIDTAKYNFSRFQIGDTLHLELSLGRSDTKKVVYYYRQYNKANFKDTLFIKGVLLKKTRETDEPHDEYEFLVRIIEVNNTELNLVDRIYQRGNIISLPLYDYGRIINK
ncbi:hypothetical protein Q4E93_23725 [Flavitalea sp. BT771]|uniref:hypothetical protein n=1 Tax=Flavitalea sp. BT771 TaxID=3063329 RepID=UPI0026E36E69|nr:hypothetical protein [Flavitalea sp. BT771]MDO6433641.1 hypothetical protein [Flavitalea sp. BT771]MDV6222454.1 hypothetical protein [Flavitalea sp. BT771]